MNQNNQNQRTLQDLQQLNLHKEIKRI
jgi:hypothetical protein